VLSCLAAKTGGMQIVPSDNSNTVAAMDSATVANVIWPDQASVKWPASFKPAMDFPPLRTDRDSMIVGTYTGDGSLTLSANTSDGEQSWSAQPENTAEKFDYIKQLVTMANGSNGLVPLVSKEDMYKAENAMFDRVNELTRLANSSINTGDIKDAQNLEKLIEESGNGQAIALDDGPTDFDLIDSAGLLDSADSSMGAITQQQVGEVTRTINDARASLRIDPEGAIQNLKNMREAVRRNADIKAADRDALVRNLEAAIREAQQYGDQMAQRNAEAARRMAEAQDRKILAEQMMSQMEKMNQMGKRFESTCKEKKYEQAQDIMVDMSNEMTDLDSRMPTAIAGIQWTRNLDNYVKQVQLRSLKQRKVCDTLYQSDKSAMPFPDEPPITYPDSTVWARLTASRRAKYSSMDLAQAGEKEKQIMKALKEPTNIELTESPLKDAIQEIHDQHHINVQIDEAAFKDEMISPEEVTLSVDGNGMSLKAALKIALSAQNLSYVIENECLYITTLTKAKEKCITKVYPVADLVMPPRMPDMSNVFTSMGNNTTSMSNSGSSGSNNNFGGGQFNIPAERLRLNAAQQAIQNENFQAFNM
ncbi:MAG: hypothetical protein IKS45_09105, partial [Thermoguttaceae bacterium]|nr:hypothetical protein [Thermoguttaceae bacterium]